MVVVVVVLLVYVCICEKLKTIFLSYFIAMAAVCMSECVCVWICIGFAAYVCGVFVCECNGVCCGYCSRWLEY